MPPLPTTTPVHAAAADSRAAVVAVERTGVVELIGPAGAGKSTLAQSLARHSARYRADLSLWGLPRALLLGSALSLVPTMIACLLAGRPLRWNELAQMARLRTLHHVVARARRRGKEMFVLDEGPVFGFAWLAVFHAAAGDPVRSRWRRRMLRDWSRGLDAIVWLDASDGEIVRRIREREKPHPVKFDPEESIVDFTERFRHAFDQVITDFAEANGVRVLRTCTDDVPAVRNVGTWSSTLEALVHVR